MEPATGWRLYRSPQRVLDRGAVDLVAAAGQLAGEDDVARPLEPGDAGTDVLADRLPVEAGRLVGIRSDFDDGADRLAPAVVADAENADRAHGVEFEDRRFDLGGVDVLAAGLDEFLLGLAGDVEQVAFLVEPADVAGVVPAAAEGVGGDVGLPVVSEEDERSADDDLAVLAGRHLAVVVVDQADGAEFGRLAGAAETLAGVLDGDEAARLALAEAGPEGGVRLVVEPLHRVWRVEPGDVAKARQAGARLRCCVEQGRKDGREVADHRDRVAVDQVDGPGPGRTSR